MSYERYPFSPVLVGALMAARQALEGMGTIELETSCGPDPSVPWNHANCFTAVLTIRWRGKTEPVRAIYRVRRIGQDLSDGWRLLEDGILTDLVLGGVMRNNEITKKLTPTHARE